jgi:hypothetical protein
MMFGAFFAKHTRHIGPVTSLSVRASESPKVLDSFVFIASNLGVSVGAIPTTPTTVVCFAPFARLPNRSKS